MSKAIKSPLRAFAELLDDADTISINGCPPMSKEEALRKFKESEKYVAAMLAADKKEARSNRDRANARTPDLGKE